MNDFYFIFPSYSYVKAINAFPYFSLKIKESRLPLSTQKDNGDRVTLSQFFETQSISANFIN